MLDRKQYHSALQIGGGGFNYRKLAEELQMKNGFNND